MSILSRYHSHHFGKVSPYLRFTSFQSTYQGLRTFKHSGI